MENKHSITMNICMPKTDADRLRERARQEDKPMSAVIRTALRETDKENA